MVVGSSPTVGGFDSLRQRRACAFDALNIRKSVRMGVQKPPPHPHHKGSHDDSHMVGVVGRVKERVGGWVGGGSGWVGERVGGAPSARPRASWL